MITRMIPLQKNNMETSKEKRPLSEADLDKIYSMFIRMSPSAKHAFIAMMIVKFHENFLQVTDRLGELYEKSVVRA